MKNDNWRLWDRAPDYGEVLFKRATGELEEMESSKSLCEVVRKLYRPGMRVADVGCGAGHYLRSLRGRVDAAIDYTGIDATEGYIARAREAFPDGARFLVGDIFALPVETGAFDLVMCNNLLLHLPPPPRDAFRELLRIAKKQVVLRTVVGERTYIIKEIRERRELEGGASGRDAVLADDETLRDFNYFNMFTEDFLRQEFAAVDPAASVEVVPDTMWREVDATSYAEKTGTRVVGGSQVSGNLLLDWRFFVVTKP